jgi:glycerol-3-phosphate acyltransferase PlsY
MLRPVNWSLALPYYAGAFLFGYLLGSIPFGLVLTRLAGTQDIRTIGSGNIGATNVLRTGRKGLAAATLVGDALKGSVAVWLATWFGGPDLGVLAALGAFLGHLFPVWLNFKGGKGVATYIGVLLALAWPAAIFFCVVWIVVAALTRYSSLAALIASAATPVFLWWYQDDLQNAELFLVLSVLLWIMHRGNIARLVRGREGKIGGSRTPATDGPTTHQ